MLLLLLSMAATPGSAQGKQDLVNPLIGTDFTGNTYPGAQRPFGMVQLSPDNGLPGWDRIAGYFYPDSTIAGFSHTHLLGTGAGDMYDISFLPLVQGARQAEAPLGTHYAFSHTGEEAHAGYYSVWLPEARTRVELTATERVGIQRYCFPAVLEGAKCGTPFVRRVLLNLGKATNWDATEATHVEQVDSVTFRGYRHSTGWARHQRVYFATRFSAPPATYHVEAGQSGPAVSDSLVVFAFPPFVDTLEIFTALSPTSMEAAEANLRAEAPHNGFASYRQQAETCWDAALGIAEAEGGSPEEATIFYTALYHSLLCPTLLSDAGRPAYYETFSLWDTFRAEHPLLTLVQPQRVADMVRSIVEFGERQGRLPVWNMWGSETDMMIGYHAAPVIADAYLKGLIPSSLARRGLWLSQRTAHLNDCGDYVPMHHRDLGGNDWSLSRTLEYAYDDACISRLARALHQDAAAREFARRAQRYRNIYNKDTGFFQPRDSMGRWQADFHPGAFTPYICESNAWPYLFNVQHDLRGLRRILGGRKAMARRLDALFTTPDADSLPIFSTGKIGQYVHGNEPSHHIAYLYSHAGQPERTRALVEQIRREMYSAHPDGLCGNEDCGQMSAWYVLSAMGFYPVDPCGGRYELGTPLFPRLTLHLPSGKAFIITRQGSGPRLRSVRLNGRRLRRSYIQHAEVLKGGRLEFKFCQ